MAEPGHHLAVPARHIAPIVITARQVDGGLGRVPATQEVIKQDEAERLH
jgi:hypothetical protein